MNRSQAIDKLDHVLRIARAEFYKPIQVAEVLRSFRVLGEGRPTDLETYRVSSRHMRDEVTQRLFGKVSTSSARYQDDVWNASAVPPTALAVLDEINRRSGVVEEYIYQHVYDKNKMLSVARANVGKLTSTSDVNDVFNLFSADLASSADRLFEIFALAVLKTQLRQSDFNYEISGTLATIPGPEARGLIHSLLEQRFSLELERLGHTNAADAGLDIWTNFGLVINVKNRPLTLVLLDQVLEDTPVGNLVIVCREVPAQLLGDVEEKLRKRGGHLLTKQQLTSDLGVMLKSDTLANAFRKQMLEAIDREFPLSATLVPFMKSRGYALETPQRLKLTQKA